MSSTIKKSKLELDQSHEKNQILEKKVNRISW